MLYFENGWKYRKTVEAPGDLFGWFSVLNYVGKENIFLFNF